MAIEYSTWSGAKVRQWDDGTREFASAYDAQMHQDAEARRDAERTLETVSDDLAMMFCTQSTTAGVPTDALISVAARLAALRDEVRALLGVQS